MDCGIPFCHQGCPLGNLIPEWNDLTWRGEGGERSSACTPRTTSPSSPGRLCPAPCEASCVLGINQPAVTIKQVEVSIIDQAFANGWVNPQPPERLTGKTVAVVGSGPAGLAAAQQLTRAGHTVAVFERDDRIGGLLRYGIPDFKMEKKHLETAPAADAGRGHALPRRRRDRQGHHVERPARAATTPSSSPPAPRVPRDLPIPGRDLAGVHFAMEYLVAAEPGGAPATRCRTRSPPRASTSSSSAAATPAPTASAPRTDQGALSVTNLAIGKQPPGERPEHQPWPMYPTVFEVASAHEEGGERAYLASTVEFLGERGGEVARAPRRRDRVRRRPRACPRPAPSARSPPTSC